MREQRLAMKLDVYNLANEKVDEIDVSESIFASEVKPHLLQEAVKMQLAKRRAGTHKTKTRHEVSGGGRKPYRQKGTGRARQGSTRAPHWVGGGHAHARRPRDYSLGMNKKAKRSAICSALSMLAAEGRLKVLDSFELPIVKTKQAVQALQTLQFSKALLVDGRNKTAEGSKQLQFDNNENLRLSVRNLGAFKYLRPEGVNVYDLLKFGALIVTREAIRGIEARLQ